MNQIQLEGIVGLDVTAKAVREALAGLEGHVEMVVNSPGGIVTDGIAIYNSIRDYRRNGGTVTARVVGMAASMATYIPMAADAVEIEDNAIWMIHNPWGLAVGDQNDMRKEADILDGMARILRRAYVNKTGKADAEIAALMDEETFLYGEEITEQGFADRIAPAGEGPESREEAQAVARDRLRQAISRTRKEAEHDIDAAAAVVRAEMPPEVPESEMESIPVVNGGSNNDARPQAGEEREVPVNKEQLMKENPDLYAGIKAEGREDGVAAERKRRDDLQAYIDADPENSRVREVVESAIAEGKTVSQINAKLQVAIRDGGKLEGENPPAVSTMPEGKAVKPATDEEVALAKSLGISVEDLRAQEKEAE